MLVECCPVQEPLRCYQLTQAEAKQSDWPAVNVTEQVHPIAFKVNFKTASSFLWALLQVDM